jgi:DNA mismatch repair protein MutL
MHDLIQLLPDAIANQIAAGEVIQRPASVVKELVENAIDAGATQISLHISDAGRSLIQVTDNGSGMSDTDARLSFERHATSKIRSASDLFSIQTFGFRGEALASIAAVAQLELKTRRDENQLGTKIEIQASTVISQESAACASGSTFAVKNLFFNTPARRKFLKSDPIEFRHILNEFYRVALPNPRISFNLYHNGEEVFRLSSTSLLLRIVQLFGKNFNQNLVALKTDAGFIKIGGFTGKPEMARKKSAEQFFFVNGRYIRHGYMHNAVVKAYDNLLQPEMTPPYFIFLEVDPASLDVNIHPTKTEVKFEDEPAIWKMLNVSVREALGKFNIMPSIDFDNPRPLQMPALSHDTLIRPPEIRVNQNYNPFETEGGQSKFKSEREKENFGNWEKLYAGFETSRSPGTGIPSEPAPMENADLQTNAIEIGSNEESFLQLKNRYILTPVKSGLMVIDQVFAFERIMYERLLKRIEQQKGVGQQSLFPPEVELAAGDAMILGEILDQASRLGFDIRPLNNRRFAIHALPADLDHLRPEILIHDLIRSFSSPESKQELESHKLLAGSLAASAARSRTTNLSIMEMNQLLHDLFACKTPAYSPSGKPCLFIMPLADIESRFI